MANQTIALNYMGGSIWTYNDANPTVRDDADPRYPNRVGLVHSQLYKVVSMSGVSEHYVPGTFSITVNGVELPGKLRISGKAPFSFNFANNTLFYRVVTYTATWGPEQNKEIVDANLNEIVMDFTQ